jgi:two-component system, OmpR family, sensor histidine kinase CiaH
MIKKLRIKFIIINMLVVTVVLLAAFTAVYITTSQQQIGQIDQALQNALAGEDPMRPQTPGRSEPGHIGITAQDPRIMTFSVSVDNQGNVTSMPGQVFSVTDKAELEDIVGYCLAQQSPTGIVKNYPLRYMKQARGAGTAIAFADRSHELSTMSSLLMTSALAGLGSFAVFFVISLFLSKWAIKPVKDAWEKQRQFVADASHELRTPLTSILSNTDIILAHKADKIASQEKWITYIKLEAERMADLVNSMLFLAKSDSAKQQYDMVSVNLSELVLTSLLPFESVIFENNKNLNHCIAPDIFINGNEALLKRLVVILLDNATKHSNENSSIYVSLAEDQEKAQLKVSNTGVPIAAGELEHIFERFYRVERSRSRDSGGSGLGLAIAQSIIQIHHAKIAVSSTSKETVFTISFNLLKRQQ